MDSVQHIKASNANSKDNQIFKNNIKHSDDFNAAKTEDALIHPNKQIRNNSINLQNKNSTGNFKIINLKQKLQDQILFGNERKHANLVSNTAQQRSKPKNYETYTPNTRASKDKYPPNNRNAGQSSNSNKITRSSSVHKGTLPAKKTIMSNLSTINIHKADHNFSNYNNFNVSAKKEEKPIKYNFDNEIVSFNNFLGKKLTNNASSSNVYGTANSRFKKPFKLLDDIRVKIDELNLTASNELQQQQNPNKTFQNFSKSKQILENMIENLREELAGISKITNQEKSEQQYKETFINENSSLPISDVILSLQAKNDELTQQLQNFKEKFVDINLENVDLRNKLKENSSIKRRNENLNLSSNLLTGTGASESTVKNRANLKSASKEKANITGNLHRLNNSPTIISLNLKTHGNNNLEAVKKLAEKVKEKELEIAEMDDKVKNITYEYKQAEKNLMKAENKIESLQKIISEVLAKSKKDQNTIESLKQQVANLSATAKDLSNLNNNINKSNFENQQLNTDTNLNNFTNMTNSNPNNNLNGKLLDCKTQEILIHLNYKINKQNDFILISDAEQLKYAWINLYNKENNVYSEAIDYYNNIYNQILSSNNISEEPEAYEHLVDYIPDFSNLNLNPNQSFNKNKNVAANLSNKKIRLLFKNLDLELDSGSNFDNIRPVYLPIEDTKEYLSQVFKFNSSNLSKESLPPAIPKSNSSNINSALKLKESEIESLKSQKENIEKEFDESKNFLLAELENRENLIANLKSDLEKLLNDNSVFIENIEKLNAELDEKNKAIEDLINLSKTNGEKINQLSLENKNLLEYRNKLKDADKQSSSEVSILKNELGKLSSKYDTDVKSLENQICNLDTKLKEYEEEISECQGEIEKLKKAETKNSNANLIFKENLNKELDNKQSEISHLHAEIALLNKDNSTKISEIKKLKSDLDAIKPECAMKQQDLDKVKAENESYKKDNSAKQSEISRLKGECENLKKCVSENSEIIKTLRYNLTQYDAEILNMNIENKNLLNKLAEKAKELEGLNEDFDALQRENAERKKLAMTQNSNLNNTLISFNNQISGLMSQIKELEEENNSLKTNKSATKEHLDADLEQKNTQIKNLKQIIQDKDSKLAKLDDSEQKNFDKLEKFKVEVDEFKRLVSKKDKELERLAEQLNSVNQILIKNEQIISELKHKILESNEIYARDRQQFEEKINLLVLESEEINKINQNFESEIKKLRDDLAKKAKEINSLKELCDAKSQEVILIKEDLKNLKNAEANKSETISKLDYSENENKKLKFEIDNLNKKLSEFDDVLQQMGVEEQNNSERIALLEKALENKSDEFDVLIEKQRELEGDLVRMHEVINEKENEIENFKKEIKQECENNEILNKEINAREGKIDSLEQQLGESKEKISLLGVQMKNCEEKISDSTAQLQQKREETKQLELQIKQMNELIDEKEYEVKDKEDQINNLNEELNKSKNEAKNTQEETNQLNSKLKNSEKLIHEMEKTISDLKSHKANIEGYLNQNSHKANEEHENFKRECEEKFKLIEAENNELEELILSYNQEIEVLKNQNDNFKKFEKENLDLLKVARIQDDLITECQSKIESLENSNRELIEALDAAETLKVQLEGCIRDLKEELEQTSKSSSHRDGDKDRKIEKLGQDKRDLEMEISELKKDNAVKINKINADFQAELNAQKVNYEQKLINNLEEHEDLNQLKNENEANIKKLSKELDLVRAEYDKKAKNIAIELNEQKETIRSLESDLVNSRESLEKANDELLGKNETLNALSELINEKICLLNTYEEENENLKAEIILLNKRLEELKNRAAQAPNTNEASNNISNKVSNTNNNKNQSSNLNNNNNSYYQNTKSENTYDSILITDPSTAQEQTKNENPNSNFNNKNNNNNNNQQNDILIANYEERIEKLNKINMELNNQILLLTFELQKSSGTTSNFGDRNFPLLLTKEKDAEENLNEIARLKEEIDKYDLENNQLKGLISDYEKCIEELEEKIADFSENINKTNTELEEKLAEKENENQILFEKLNIYEYGLNDYKEKEKHYAEQLAKLTEEKKIKERELESYIAGQNSNNAKGKLTQQQQNLTEENINMKNILEEKDKEIMELREALEIYDQKLSEFESQKDNENGRDEEETEKAEVYLEQIQTLKNLIRQKDLKINELTKEIEDTKFEFDKYLKTNEDDNKSRMSYNFSSTEPNDERKQAERLEKYKSAAQNYKQNNELLMRQLTVLKDEIKMQKARNENLLNFEGRIKDYDEFKNLFSLSTDSYKPKKKEQEEALRKLREHLSINLNELGTSQLLTDNSSVNNEKKKGGLLGFFSKKK